MKKIEMCEAAKKDLAAGFPVTYQEGSYIIQEYPDGRKIIIGETDPWIPYIGPKKIILKK